MNGSVLYLHLLLEDKDSFKKLDDTAKMHTIIQMVKRKVIKDTTDLNKGLALVDWDQKTFLAKFKELWDKKLIGWEELDALDNNDHVFKGPGFLSDRWLLWNIGDKELCNRIPSKHWDSLPYCRAYKEQTGL